MSEKDFDKGYKSGFQFGKEVANEEWMNRIKKAREEIDDLYRYYDNDFCSGNNDSMFKCNEVLKILDKLIESEGVNENRCV